MGHTLIDVGEEYDGGFNYSGVNSAKDVQSVPWAHWYTDRSSEVRTQRTNVPMLVYPWKLLDSFVRWSHTFNSAGTYSSYVIQFSVSGVAATGDLRIDMDGDGLDWEANHDVGLDRWIYKIKINKALTTGTHNLGFTLLNRSRQGSAQLCHVEVTEFGAEDEWVT
ncbi:hypothetical protein Daus18300_000516 [Diaporthe australafricana]|uniref:Uncharacterized protein n=1 Tax=Diaporthe australafricana TaxID=127596 RepID=A0ABR3Y3J2_9PEZI